MAWSSGKELDTCRHSSEQKLFHSAREAAISPGGYNILFDAVGRCLPSLLLNGGGEQRQAFRQDGINSVLFLWASENKHHVSGCTKKRPNECIRLGPMLVLLNRCGRSVAILAVRSALPHTTAAIRKCGERVLDATALHICL